jgi:hypothetical protein
MTASIFPQRKASVGPEGLMYSLEHQRHERRISVDAKYDSDAKQRITSSNLRYAAVDVEIPTPVPIAT